MIAGPYRARINASTMLAQSKNIFQASIYDNYIGILRGF